MIEITNASDYAEITTPHFRAYYGYEYEAPSRSGDIAQEDSWGFEFAGSFPPMRHPAITAPIPRRATLNLSFREMTQKAGSPNDLYDCKECLLFGLSLVVEDLLGNVDAMI
jgi:hypothetical protein